MGAYDLVVAGLGAMGSAILARASGRARVLGIDRHARGHALGASSGKSRIIRQAYFEDAAYVPLLLRAYELWHDLERRSNLEIVRLCGLLMCGRRASEIVVGSTHAARAYDLPVEHLEAPDIRKRYPSLSVLDHEVGVFERLGGVVFPERANEAHLQMAERAGAHVRFDTSLQSWSSDGSKVTLALSDGSTIEAASLVIATGPWIARELAAIGVRLDVQRNVQAWFAPNTRAYDAADFPAFLIERDAWPVPLYGFPDFGDGVKAAFHGLGALTNADALDRTIDFPSDIGPIARALDAWMPGAAGSSVDAKACAYALTPDRNFVVDRHPSYENVILCGGFSGHGFKFASVIGEIGADLALTGGTQHDIAFLGAGRF